MEFKVDQAKESVFVRSGSNICLMESIVGPPGVSGIWGELLFIFRDLGELGSKLKVLGI